MFSILFSGHNALPPLISPVIIFWRLSSLLPFYLGVLLSYSTRLRLGGINFLGVSGTT